MNRKNLALMMLLLAITTIASAQSIDKLWTQVAQAEKNGLPATAIKLTDEIFQKAQAAKNTPQMLKAYTWRMKYQELLVPDSFYVAMNGLQQWVAESENPIDRAVLHSLIAGMYADYASENRWLLRQRTPVVDEVPADDMRTWTSNQFVDVIRQHVAGALQPEELLRQQSAASYVPFVELGKSSGSYYEHNLYQLLGMRAIESLKITSTLSEDSLIYAQIDTLYQHLAAVNRSSNRIDGYVMTQLSYLEWKRTNDTTFRSYQAPTGLLGLTQNPYLAGLNDLIGEFQSQAICAEVYLARAQYAYDQGQAVSALTTCDEAIERYSNYARIGALRNLKKQILNPMLRMDVSQIVYPDSVMTLQLSHKNIDQFSVKLYRVNLPELPELPNGFTAEFYRKHCQKVTEETFQLIRPVDYQSADTTLTLPTPAEGLYVLQLAPTGKTTGKHEAQVLRVTRFKVLTRRLPHNEYEAVVLDLKTGYPIADAQVTLYNYREKVMNQLTTNEKGKVQFAWRKEYRQLGVRRGEDTAMPLQTIYQGGYFYQPSNKPSSQVKLLTDRSLYRPGQTVYVKGIAYSQLLDTAHVIANARYTVTLLDANRQEVAQQTSQTNDFGSFTTSFTLPAACLNGRFTLQTESGSTTIRVEEYKRPTFDITFDKSMQSYQLGDEVVVTGVVKSFSGVALQNVPVNYTVKRLRRLGWRMPQQNNEFIASGTVQLNDEGAFNIPVTLAGEDTAIGYFQFEVEATVTNLAGETQSTTLLLPVGNRSLLLQTTLSERVCTDDSLTTVFRATNLSGEPVAVVGTVALYPFPNKWNKTLPQPEEVKRTETPLYSGSFTSNEACELSAWRTLPSGDYLMLLSANDDQGREVMTTTRVLLFSTADKRPPTETPEWFYASNTSFDAAHPAQFYFGTSCKDAYVMMDVFSGDEWLESKTLQLSDTIVRFDYPYQEAYGNGLTISFCFVKEEKVYRRQVALNRRLADKSLIMKWEVFRDKLRPGQEEEWKLTIRNPQLLPAAAEMLATMYDASLDKISKQQQGLQLYYNLPLSSVHWMEQYTNRNYYYIDFPYQMAKVPAWSYDRFAISQYSMMEEVMVVGYGRGKSKALTGSTSYAAAKQSSAPNQPALEIQEESVELDRALLNDDVAESLPQAGDELRTNFAETAFFYPQLLTNEQGEISFSFTLPQSLTRWNFRGYAHTQGMLTGTIEGEATTSKEFMIAPNLPRFVRVGDQTQIAATLTNVTDKSVKGVTTLTLFDPLTDRVIRTQKQSFAVESGKITVVNFAFTASDKYELLGCRIVAEGDTFSDGEQQILPVLSDKVSLTESVPMLVRGEEKRVFELDSLFNGHSPSATHKRLTVEFTSNPAWFAVLALPALSQPKSDNAMEWAAMYYANTLASFIMNSQPRIKAMFESWKQQGGSKETFLSNLQKNEALKNIVLAESPWVMEAHTEQQQQERIGLLFDLNTIRNNNLTALTKLAELQLADGSWSWYKGMVGSLFTTQFIVETQARLTKLTGEPLSLPAQTLQQVAWGYLHNRTWDEYTAIRKAESEGRKPSGLSTSALNYLYLVALSKEEIPAKNKAAYQYFLAQLPSLLGTMNLNDKAMAALILNEAGKVQQAQAFMASLKEHLVEIPEQGLSVARSRNSIYGQGSAISTHVAVMEAFDQVSKDTAVVEEMKIWLLRQKQTQQWNSPVATVDAVYALLRTGANLLADPSDVRLTVGTQVIQTTTPNQGTIAGLGYLKESFTAPKVINARRITVDKRDAGVAWGAVYGTYLEGVDRVKQQGNELAVEKKLYVERLVNRVPQLEPLTAGKPLAVGDKVVSRLTIRLDRAMQFVQLSEQRAACLEPINQVSGYRWSNGLGYYLDVKDASTRFFFEGLDKGTFVLESTYRVSRAGVYEAGLATIQCAYAPEFVAHSKGEKLVVE